MKCKFVSSKLLYPSKYDPLPKCDNPVQRCPICNSPEFRVFGGNIDELNVVCSVCNHVVFSVVSTDCSVLVFPYLGKDWSL